MTTYHKQAEEWGKEVYYRNLKYWERKNLKEQFDEWLKKYDVLPPDSILASGKIPFEKYYGTEYYVKNYSLDLKKIQENFNIKEFKKESEEWFDFIAEYRSIKKLNCKSDHDITIGPLADGGELTIILDMFEHNEITKEAALEQIKFKGNNNQYCIHSDEILKDYLKYEGCDIYAYSDT